VICQEHKFIWYSFGGWLSPRQRRRQVLVRWEIKSLLPRWLLLHHPEMTNAVSLHGKWTEWQKNRTSSSSLQPFHQSLSHSWLLNPHGLVTSQRPYLFIPPQWRLSFNTWNWRDIQTMADELYNLEKYPQGVLMVLYINWGHNGRAARAHWR
jgi:hypothetical protein